jgi:hypothetical protein
MTDQVLDTYATVTLNGAGAGTVTLSPESFRTWNVTRIAVRTSQGPRQTPIPQCTVYLGSQNDGNIIDQTWSGSRDTSDCDFLVQPSQPLIIAWANGISGTTATASIYGTQSMR